MDLIDMVHHGSLKAIKKLVAGNGIPKDSTYTDYKALNLSLELRKKKIAIFLIKKECRVNETVDLSITGFSRPAATPLHNAVKLGNLKIVRLLLNRKASLTALDSQGNSPLHLSFILGHSMIKDLILSFLKKTSEYANLKNYYGLTHFCIACTSKNYDLILNYIKSSADLNEKIKSHSPYYPGYTAMHFALEFQSPMALQLLLEHNGNIFNREILSAIFESAKTSLGELSVMVYLLSNYIYKLPSEHQLSQFHLACLQSNATLVNSFLEHGAPVNNTVSEEVSFCALYTPLHCAVESNSLDNIKLLLQHGADVTMKNVHGMTPLHLALYRENHCIVRILYESTQNIVINCTDVNGLSYFHVAVALNDLPVVRMFLTNRVCSVNTSISQNHLNFSGYTALHFAIRYGHLEMVSLLIKKGANIQINDLNRHGTPLHMAVAAGNDLLIDFLLKGNARLKALRLCDNKNMLHLLAQSFMDADGRARQLLKYVQRFVFGSGVNINAQDSYGNTPLHYVCKKISVGAPLAELFLKCGADVNVTNNVGAVPFEMAFYDSYRNNAKDYILLFDHVKGLEKLKLFVHPQNNAYCIKLLREHSECQKGAECLRISSLNKKQQERTMEMLKMKKSMLSTNVSLYDFIRMDDQQLYCFANNGIERLTIITNSFLEDFSNFRYLVKLSLHRLEELKLTSSLL